MCTSHSGSIDHIDSWPRDSLDQPTAGGAHPRLLVERRGCSLIGEIGARPTCALLQEWPHSTHDRDMMDSVDQLSAMALTNALVTPSCIAALNFANQSSRTWAFTMYTFDQSCSEISACRAAVVAYVQTRPRHSRRQQLPWRSVATEPQPRPAVQLARGTARAFASCRSWLWTEASFYSRSDVKRHTIAVGGGA